MTKILHVTTPLFTAQATFERQGRDWKCTRASPSVDWMEVVTLEAVKCWLERNRYEWRWEAVNPAAETEAALVAPETGPAHR